MKAYAYKIIFIFFFLINLNNLFCQDLTKNQYTIPNEYGEVKVILNGNIKLKEYFGPPNYGETPKIDIVEKCYVLKTDEKITFSNGIDKITIEEFQLLIGNDFKGNIDPDLDYVVVGKAFYAHTGHHHTPIIIFVEIIYIKI